MTTGRIFVCATCDRYAASPAAQARPGQALAQAIRQRAAQRGAAIAVRAVECLNGCPHPCAAALRMPGKMVIRFSGLTVDDAPALLDVAYRYADSPDGDVPTETLPESLRGKVSDRVSVPTP